MKYFISVSILLLITLLMPHTAIACSCIAPEGPLEEMSKSDFVFSGIVKRITSNNGPHGITLNVRLQVLSKWKGELPEEVIIETADNSAACGYPFDKGKSYLVYGHLHEGEMSTSICTRTTRLGDASEDLTALGQGEEVSYPQPRCGGPTSAVVIQTFMFLMIGFPILRKRRLRL